MKVKTILSFIIFVHALSVSFVYPIEKNIVDHKNYELVSYNYEYLIESTQKVQTTSTDSRSLNVSNFIDPNNRKIRITKFANATCSSSEFSYYILIEVPTLTPYFSTFL